MEEQNWRTEVDAFDYFGHQKKKTQVADRRPVIRKPSDLVGPGIAQSATVVTDWNDVLATFNGYFSSTRALNAPLPDLGDDDYDSHLYVGFVTMDATYGGKQIITDLDTGMDYSRIFRRAPVDPNTIVWGPWVGSSMPDPTAFSSGNTSTTVPPSVMTPLNAPVLDGSNWQATYQSSGTNLNLLRDGVYTGVIRVYSFTGASGLQNAGISVTYPRGLVTETLDLTANISAPDDGARIPFTFMTWLDSSFLTVSALHSVGGGASIYWGIDITRTSGVR